MSRPVSEDELDEIIDSYVGTKAPGLQYLVLDGNGTLFEHSGGLARIAEHVPMTQGTTLMAYSMTKTITAVAVLQLAEEGRLDLDQTIDVYLPDLPDHYSGATVRQLLAHTAGIPNPIPLRWVHLSTEHATFDEGAALLRVLNANPNLSAPPGAKFGYSNIGYWLLGSIVERVSGQAYEDYVRENLFEPLGATRDELDFDIGDADRHANGHLGKYSLMNLAKGFLMDRKFWRGYEGNWLRFENHYLDGPAFGGLVGTSRGFALFLRDQLQPRSVLLGPEGKKLLETQQTDNGGQRVPMTLGWHVGDANGLGYFFKEGGGGGFHGEMRLYPRIGIASVVLVNGTEFNSNRFLDRVDAAFLDRRASSH